MKALGPETPKKLTLYFSRNNSSKFANLLFTVTFWSTTTANNENGLYLVYLPSQKDSPGGSNSKASAYNAGDPGSIPGGEVALEKEMATHSSTLVWKIPWTEESGRLQSMGSQRVGHD